MLNVKVLTHPAPAVVHPALAITTLALLADWLAPALAVQLLNLFRFLSSAKLPFIVRIPAWYQGPSQPAAHAAHATRRSCRFPIRLTFELLTARISLHKVAAFE